MLCVVYRPPRLYYATITENEPFYKGKYSMGEHHARIACRDQMN